MKTSNRYESPAIKEFETILEGFVCGSGTTGMPGLPGHGQTGDQDAGGSEGGEP